MANGGKATRQYAPRLAPDARRKQLLDAALELIAENGYGEITIEAIAGKIGVTRPVVYSVFANIDELLITLLDRQDSRALAQVQDSIADRGAGPGAVIRDSFEAFLRSILDQPQAWKMILQGDDSSAPRGVRERFREGRDETVQTLATTLEGSIGEVPADFDVEIAAEAVVTLAQRAGILMLEDPDSYPMERLLRMADGIALAVEHRATA